MKLKLYYSDEWVTQYCSDALTVLRELEGESIDLLCTDPPYGIGFMGKDWDKALPDKQIWAECLRVLKPGAFAFVMSIPRSDCQARMVIALQDAGFMVNFTPIFWAYASGFPKAQNIGKAVDKRLGELGIQGKGFKVAGDDGRKAEFEQTLALRSDYGYVHQHITPQAKALDGSYGGFQPKPAVEVIIVCMKPLSEKTFVDQALKNQKGITWLDDARIPCDSKTDFPAGTVSKTENVFGGGKGRYADNPRTEDNQTASRFPANLLVSDDVLNDGRVSKSGKDINPTTKGNDTAFFGGGSKYYNQETNYGDSGSFSRYFDLDKWAQKIFPFLIVPKASKSEKNKGCEDIIGELGHNRFDQCAKCGGYIFQNPDRPSACKCVKPERIHNRMKGNIHPTCKPLKLMSYLITLGSRPGDTVVDPFGGSGTTAKASKLLGRHCIIIETEEKYCEIAAKRCSQSVMELRV